MSPRHAPPSFVQIPPDGGDRPSWVKVGVIAAVGFAIGVAWPRLAGIRPGPSAPSETVAAAPSARAPEAAPAPAASSVATAPSSAPAAASAPAASLPAGAATRTPAVLVTRGAVLTCKTEAGQMQKGAAACGSLPDFDLIAQPRLKRLAQCPVAADASGKLSIVFNLDFVRNRATFEVGRTTTLDNKDSFAQCLRMSMEKVSINAVAHEHPLYAVFYSVTFTPRERPDGAPVPVATSPVAGGAGGAGANAAAAGAMVTPVSSRDSDASSPSAQVAWEVAIVRDAPRTGAVVARLQRGTKVRIGAGQEGWYRVRFGKDFGSEGWVYRASIGK